MTTHLPSYNADVAPPSYDEIAKKLEGLVGSHPTPRKWLDAAGKLSPAEVRVIEDNAQKHPPIAEHQKRKFAIGAATTLSEDVEELIDDTAEDAIKGAAKIRSIFSVLESKIMSIDLIHQSDFNPELQKHKKRFNEILNGSQNFASILAVTAMDFEDVIIEFCANKNYTIEERITIINGHIADVESHESKAQQIKSDFHQLGTDLNALKASFATWADEKEAEIKGEIKQLQDDIEKLSEELAKLEAAMLGLGLAAGVGLPVLVAAAALSGPLAPFVAIGGLIAIGATAVTIAGLAIRAAVLRNEIKAKQAEITSKQGTLAEIQKARIELKELGEQQMVDFQNNMTFLIKFWSATSSDAIAIKTWLEKGADAASIPDIMEARLQHGVEVYKKMAEYLRKYAGGVRKLVNN